MAKNDRWLKGPDFLWEEEDHCPQMKGVPVLKDDDTEVRKEAPIYVTTVQSNILYTLISRYSSWWKLKRAVAWLLCYKEYLRVKARQKNNGSTTGGTSVKPSDVPESKFEHLTVAELNAGEVEILRRVQVVAFPDVVKILATTQHAKGAMKKLFEWLEHPFTS